MIMDIDFDIEQHDRAEIGRRPAKPGACCCLASCCCCSGSHAQAPAGGMLDVARD